jgi:hypothetical protein
MGSKKLGHPVPLSNLVSDVKSGSPHAAHAKVPARFSSFSGLVKARSVPLLEEHGVLLRRQLAPPLVVRLLQRGEVLRCLGHPCLQSFVV